MTKRSSPLISPARTAPSFGPWLVRLQQTWQTQTGTLELLLPRGWPESDGVIHWRLRGASTAAAHGEVTELHQIPGMAAITRVHVWTPAAETLLTRATLPTRARAKIQQALPFALEEQLIGEPDQLQFSYRQMDDASLAVAVTAHERLKTWLTKLTEAGLRPTTFSPAILALPYTANNWTAAFRGDEIWVRTDIAAGFACTGSSLTVPPMLTAALREARAQSRAPENISIFQPPVEFDEAAWSKALDLPLSIQQQDFWITHFEPVPALNLLQGAFAPAKEIRQLMQAALPAAILFSVWLIGSLGFNTWEWWQLKHAHDKLRQEMTTLFRSTFPQAQVVVDPALQMQRLLGELEGNRGKTSGNDLLPLLSGIAPVMQSAQKIKLRGLQYDDAKLTIEITLPDFQTMETIKNAFAAQGIQVEVLNANSGTSGIEGRLRLSKAPG